MLSNVNTLYVIGNNKYGELGLNHKETVNKLTNWNKINYISIANISNGSMHTIFIDANNHFFSAGRNNNGQCACHRDNKCIIQPTRIHYFDNRNITIRKVHTSVGDNNNTFWITKHFRVFGNGENEYFQLGIVPSKPKYHPTNISCLTNVIDIKGGRYHNIALCGTALYSHEITMILQYWYNYDIVDRKYLPNDIILMVKRYQHTNNTIYSAGQPNNYNEYGQNGLGYALTIPNKWRNIEALKDKSIMKIACGAYHTLFLAENGELFACGNSSGGCLGIGLKKPDKFHVFERVELFVIFKVFVMNIRCGFGHNLCVDSKGKVWSWGHNMFGQCGVGSSKNINSPKMIQMLKDCKVVNIKCGFWHSYVKVEKQLHYLFGYNVENQCSLSDNDKLEVLKPYCIDDVFSKITNGKKIKDVFLGNKNTFILSE
eukprot:276007_1